MSTRHWLLPFSLLLTLILLPALLLGIAAMLTYPTLPSLDVLTDYHPKVPLRVYSAEGTLIGEFGTEHRALVKIADVPDMMKNAILAAEDDRFYQHGGVDYIGVMRAALSNFTAGGTRQGASTITMQVARNFFLSKEKTFTRKFNEALLAFKIEHYLSKDEILQLYINQIYLGQRSYGFAAASKIYFGKPLKQLSISESAMLAGLPKAPSSYNPVVNPKRAKLRQLYVLRRMHQLQIITDAQYNQAKIEPIILKHGQQKSSLESAYLTEMVRQIMVNKYKDSAYTRGLRVYTTIRQKDQQSAYHAVRKGVLDYDRRHGYRGPEGFVDLSEQNSEKYMDASLQKVDDNDDLLPAIVLAVSAKRIEAYAKGGKRITLEGKALSFARRALGKRISLKKRIVVGSLIRVQKNTQGRWQISQLPQVEGAFVSGDPQSGAIFSLVGGFDFNQNQFNHVTQAWRQPGSSFKPFIYSAALEKGFTPATLINDAPLTFNAKQTGSKAWQPKNYENTYAGPMRMREALIHSKNLVSIRILQAITPSYAQDYITKFGFPADKHPPYLTMALGAGSVTPLQLLTGYSVFANSGFITTPYFIQRIEDAQGNILSQANPLTANHGAKRVIDVRNAYTMVSMMEDVVKHGTGRKAMTLGRHDLAGKTGTTSDSIDAWFCGFQPTVVGIAWMGFDKPRSLGRHETGSGAALPIWISYMKDVLEEVPQARYTMPKNMVALPIDDEGRLDKNSTRIEYFYQESIPDLQTNPLETATPSDQILDQLL
ncbi:MAG: penicillin-binding protein 1A [Gallionella sp.]